MTIYKFKKDPFSSHKRMADCILEENARSVLDVGCNKGQLLKALDGWSGVIWGIDINREVLTSLRGKYTKTIYMDIIHDIVPFEKKFDAVVFGDVLEHTTNPDEIIKKFINNLKPEGVMIISAPNVANWFIRLSLLFGNFDYTPSGILDQTHLRFFTLNSMKKIINNCGLKIQRIKATPIPLPLIFPLVDLGKPLFFIHVLNYAITKIRKSLFGYQFVFKTKLK